MKNISPPQAVAAARPVGAPRLDQAVAAAKPVGAFRDGEPRSLFSRKPKFVLDALARAGVSPDAVDSAFAADDLDFLVDKEPAAASAPVEARPGPTKAVSGQARTGFAAASANPVTAPVEGRLGPAKSGTCFAAAAAKPAAAKTVTAAEFGRMEHQERNRFIREGGHVGA